MSCVSAYARPSAVVHDLDGRRHLHERLLLQDFAKRPALEELHHHETHGFLVHEVVDLEDPRVEEPGDRAHFLEEPGPELLPPRLAGRKPFRRTWRFERRLVGPETVDGPTPPIRSTTLTPLSSSGGDLRAVGVDALAAGDDLSAKRRECPRPPGHPCRREAAPSRPVLSPPASRGGGAPRRRPSGHATRRWPCRVASASFVRTKRRKIRRPRLNTSPWQSARVFTRSSPIQVPFRESRSVRSQAFPLNSKRQWSRETGPATICMPASRP